MKAGNKVVVILVLAGIIIIISGSGNLSTQEKQLYKYVGLEKCASVCHSNNVMGYQYDIIMKSNLVKAYEILGSKKAMHYARKANVKENPQESFICLKCHTTGGGYGSDSFTETYNKEEGITCEACHKSQFNPKTVLPKEEDCRKCHNNSVHKVTDFNFKERSARIAHPRLNGSK